MSDGFVKFLTGKIDPCYRTVRFSNPLSKVSDLGLTVTVQIKMIYSANRNSAAASVCNDMHEMDVDSRKVPFLALLKTSALTDCG